ncbi:hypothetical protein [Roseivivax sp. THAF40]|uniref:hypothetical protein n=1 Tax=Roseivivax sp. THAF40 TaxID=2587858 RepID=UPI0012691A7A|nr:hypothetical protein [Roseivivax sp. THAF40]
MTYRAHIAALLAAILALVSVELAIARGAPAIAGQVVLCGGLEREVITLDVNGDPVRHSQLCPDAATAFFAAPVAATGVVAVALRYSKLHVDTAMTSRAQAELPRAQARAPPVSI